MSAELVLADGWHCVSLPPGTVEDPADLSEHLDWLAVPVPGTAAAAWRAAGRPLEGQRFDESDWWFRCRFQAPAGRWWLELDGVATLGDVWCNGRLVGTCANMFRPQRFPVVLAQGANELAVRCRSLTAALAERRPRPRWKTYMVPHQNLRWFRTSLLGRVPGQAVVPPPVGLWRPVRLTAPEQPDPAQVVLQASCEGDDGVVAYTFTLPATASQQLLRVRAGGASGEPAVRRLGDQLVAEGRLRLPGAERWWPHTHGPQPLYEVWADVGQRSHRLGRVGFRTVAVERDAGAFRVVVNGQPVFCRGATWTPVDPVSLVTSEETLRQRLGLVRQAHLNMVRVPGTAVYESRRFLELCDELGIMVWHDCMFAFMDPPTEAAFEDEVFEEVADALGVMAGHPALAVVCGNQEVEEIAAMNGLAADRSATRLFDETIPRLVETHLCGVPYVTSNPTGGDLPFRMDHGVSQYFGVGGYLRPVEDARRSGVRFAAECLAFSTPPEPETVDEVCGGAYRANHDPFWKAGVHHDAGSSWDMEDVRAHYVAALFGADPLHERYVDPERALELGRAANAQLMGAVLAEFRRPGSSCDGALIQSFNDLRAGAGWGIVDSQGRPKAPWYVLRRVLQPVGLLAIDEGLNGLCVYVLNDAPMAFSGRLEIEVVTKGELVTDRASEPVRLEPRGWCRHDAERLLGGFRDLTYAYRFSPPAHDAVVASLWSDEERLVSQAVHLPLGQARPLEADLGLQATARTGADGRWLVEVSTERLAQWVTVRASGFVAEDSWFHLPPGSRRTVRMWGQGDEPPRGSVQALNSVTRVPIKIDKTAVE